MKHESKRLGAKLLITVACSILWPEAFSLNKATTEFIDFVRSPLLTSGDELAIIAFRNEHNFLEGLKITET